MEAPKFHAGEFYSGANESRARRRARHAAAQRLSRETRGRRRSELRAAHDEEKAANPEGGYLPAGGEAGPAALRSYRRLRVQQHRATSEAVSYTHLTLPQN